MSFQSSKRARRRTQGTSNRGKMTEQLILEVIIKQVEEKKVIRSSQHGFIPPQGEIMLDQSDSFLLWRD